jgi:hypothetical protein
MKIIKKILVLLFLVPLSYGLQAQYHPILAYFNVQVEDNGIELNWSVIGGNTCNGIRIYHSNDDSVYRLVGEIPGICGSSEADISYRFKHENIQQQGLQYYKLELGFQGFSDPISVSYYFLNASGIGLYPNPGVDHFVVYVPFVDEQTSVEVFTAKGELLLEQDLEPQRANSIDMHRYPSGVYIIRVRTQSGIVKSTRWIKL